MIQWAGYTDSLDRYYGRLVDDPANAHVPGHKYPKLVEQILEFFFLQREMGFVHASRYLLDILPDALEKLTESITPVLEAQRLREKRRFLSTTGERALSVSCYQEGVVERDADLAKRHALASILINQGKPRLLLELGFSGDGELREAHFEYLTEESIRSDERDRLLAMKEDVVASRFKLHGDPRAIGRNDPCVCGSGRKYKKCCWGSSSL